MQLGDLGMPNLIEIPADAARLLLETGGIRLCPLLKSRDFAEFCSKRGHKVSRERLLGFERLRLFFPIFRVMQGQADRRRLLLPMKDPSPFDEGWVIDTASRPQYLVPDEDDRTSEAYYSPFQIASLTFVLSQFTANVALEGFLEERADNDPWLSNGEQLGQWARSGAEHAREHQFRPAVDLLCQFISDRYYPQVRGNQRTIQISEGSYSFDLWTERSMQGWRWREYASEWEPKEVERIFDLTPDKLRHAYEALAGLQSQDDPLASWHQLVKFVSVRERDRLKDLALGALTMREGALMLRLLHKDLYGEELRDPNEIYGTIITHIPELEARHDPRRYLEYVVNRYDLNPRPKLTLFLEGHSEELAVRQIFEQYFGADPGTHGIEIMVLGGVDAATGTKEDRFRAILRLVDYLHYHQTMTFLILDNERQAKKLKAGAKEVPSTLHAARFATRADHVRLWRISFEFDNFSDTEIARAMTAITGGNIPFTSREISACRRVPAAAEALVKLCRHKTGNKPDKAALAKELSSYLFSPSSRRKIANRPLVKILERVADLAAMNPFPTMQESWEYNQNSSYLGTVKKSRARQRRVKTTGPTKGDC